MTAPATIARGTVKVLVVDDSALVRTVLTKMLAEDPAIQVVGAAPNPFVARDMILDLQPDVLTLDIEMPRMDGLAFLEKLMLHHPLPVVVVSSLTKGASELTLQALELGAVDVVAKPALEVGQSLEEIRDEVVEKVHVAARVSQWQLRRQFEQRGQRPAPPTASHALANTTDKVIAIGASTGGTQAIKQVLCGLPADAPGVVVVQHMPVAFTAAFAEQLNEVAALNVREAHGGERVIPGTALVAPGDMHLLLRRSGGAYTVRLSDGPRVNRHRPSVGVLFQSVAKFAGRNAVGALLTGMGHDGADGMKQMRTAGAYTIAQDEATCVVYGMPREAVHLGAAVEVAPIERIAERIITALE